jgi:hypothetical protein
LLVIDRVPLAFPVVVGANLTVKAALCPAPTVIGVDTPFKLKPDPEMPIADTVALAFPGFVSVTG